MDDFRLFEESYEKYLKPKQAPIDEHSWEGFWVKLTRLIEKIQYNIRDIFK